MKIAALLCSVAGLLFAIKGLVSTNDRTSAVLGPMWIAIGMALLAVAMSKTPKTPSSASDSQSHPTDDDALRS